MSSDYSWFSTKHLEFAQVEFPGHAFAPENLLVMVLVMDL